jgi:hypothetical protein
MLAHESLVILIIPWLDLETSSLVDEVESLLFSLCERAIIRFASKFTALPQSPL